MTALLVQKLRFERILRGDPELRRAFDDDPESFARQLQRYLRAVPARALFPTEEAHAFREFTSVADRGVGERRSDSG